VEERRKESVAELACACLRRRGGRRVRLALVRSGSALGVAELRLVLGMCGRAGKLCPRPWRVWPCG